LQVENILESPAEKDFVENKNGNIWRIKEIDMREKPEHDFSTDSDLNFDYDS